ncbi:MAG: carboxypeptidase-like regulatory domain-containing protein [Planctomycetota bacterium]
MRLLVPLALLVLVALGALLWTRDAPETSRVERLAPAPAETVDAAESGGLVDTDSAEDRRAVDPVETAETIAADDVPLQRCTVRGRVVDAAGDPIEGATVQLAAFRTWNEETEASPIPPFEGLMGNGWYGFETRSAADGSFEIQAAPPSGERQRLVVFAGRFSSAFETSFGDGGDELHPLLRAGDDRDLGTIWLLASGVIRGTVTDLSGAPVEGVEMGISPMYSINFNPEALTDASGRYVLERAPVGTFQVTARHDDYAGYKHDSVTVEAGVVSDPVDLVLERAKTVSGRVVDEDGAPVHRARLRGRLPTGKRGRSTRSDEDGRFTLRLAADEAHTLEVTHPDFDDWDEPDDPTSEVHPGQLGLEIVLRRAAKTTFRVIDGTTGEPVERFGLHVLENNGSRAKPQSYTTRGRPRHEDRPDGTVEAKATVGVDAYLVYAPGYLQDRGDVEHDEEGTPVQTVALAPGARLLGRAVRDGAGVAGARVEAVELWRGRPQRDTEFRVLSDPEGRFALEGLEAEVYRLTIRPRDGAPAVLRDLRPEPPETLDVGEVEIVDGGTIVGVVEVPPDIDPKGLRVHLGPWEDEITTVTDTDGRFRFENVAPGRHELGQAGIDGVLDAGVGAVADVTSGETTSVVLDVTPFLLATVELDVVVGGEPAVGFSVEIRAVGAADSVDFMREAATRFELETTDEEGTARGTGRAFGPARVLLGVPGVGRFEHPTARVDVTHGALVKETVHLDLATLELAGLDRLPMPTEGRLAVKLEDARGALSTARFSFRIEGGRPVVPDGGLAEASDGTFALEALVDGEVDATVHAVAKDAPRVRTDLGEGRWRSGPERAFERTVRVVLRAGERTRVDLD